MFKKISLKAKIIGGSCITLILLVIVGVIGVRATRSLMESNQWVVHTYEVIAEAKQILSTAVDMETGMRGYLLAGEDGFLDPYTRGKENFYRQIATLSKRVDDNPAQVRLLAEAKTRSMNG
ncbi:MAG: hypothetical protein GY859_08770 [Desulfobacterales bacterium]|nr:hypothetical protein [Desulfobacterales bacterium]